MQARGRGHLQLPWLRRASTRGAQRVPQRRRLTRERLGGHVPRVRRHYRGRHQDKRGEMGSRTAPKDGRSIGRLDQHSKASPTRAALISTTTTSSTDSTRSASGGTYRSPTEPTPIRWPRSSPAENSSCSVSRTLSASLVAASTVGSTTRMLGGKGGDSGRPTAARFPGTRKEGKVRPANSCTCSSGPTLWPDSAEKTRSPGRRHRTESPAIRAVEKPAE